MPKVLFIERKFQGFYSIEKVFRQVAAGLTEHGFKCSFDQVPAPAGVSGIIRNLLFYRPSTADIFHVTGDITYMALVLPRERTVITVHDTSILKFRKGVRRWVLEKLLFELPVRRARFVTAVSAATASELAAYAGSEKAIVVIENPVDPSFLDETKHPFNFERPNILQIGTLPYKNLTNLIRAIEGLSCRLTIIGRLSEQDKALLEAKQIEYINEFDIERDAVHRHYREADIVTFCSTYEGFGLPIIEAQATRTPVVTSNVEPMRSVAGDGAVLVDPHDPGSIREGVLSLIHDPDLRRRIVAAGEGNLERFRTERIAESYAEIYRDALMRLNDGK